MSTGSHFQFKHEKSWNTAAIPTEYDKYFEINPDNLAIALSSITFYERNDLLVDMFSNYDVTNMKNRASKYKEKYESKLNELQNVEKSKTNTTSTIDSNAVKANQESNRVEKDEIRNEDENTVNSDFKFKTEQLPVECKEVNDSKVIESIEIKQPENDLDDILESANVNIKNDVKKSEESKLTNLKPASVVIDDIHLKPTIEDTTKTAGLYCFTIVFVNMQNTFTFYPPKKNPQYTVFVLAFA